jgi:demethylmenaquinone methyltransferase / 2-methoxy-6-polyprenyl-1,4-benzoquinol methylase
MADLTGPARAAYVSRMFDRISRRYDLLNRLMTFGQDRRWRREAVLRLALPPQARVLDLGAGTGDLAFEVLRQHPDARLAAGDFSRAMMQVGRRRSGGEGVAWVLADALRLPFRANTFDGVVSGFLMRNVSDLPAAFAEQARLLRPAGRAVCLDTTPPRSGWMRPLLRLHLHVVIPLLGRLIAGEAEAYNYLPDSTERFLDADALAQQMTRAGLSEAGYVRRMLGTIAIHSARKPG